MKYKYTPIEKDQKGNPFCKMTTQDHNLLQIQLTEILHFLCQLGSSTDTKDRQFYEIIVDERSAKAFGKSGEYSWAANTALAALSGAVQKLSRGDLSMKQLENIRGVLDAVHKVYPKKFSRVEFESVAETEILTDFERLFDA